MTTQEFESALAKYIAALNENQRAWEGPTFPENCRGTVLADSGGKKYVRVFVKTGDSRSCYCFVEKETGDILKSASWKAPAKGARGNIYTVEVPANGMRFASTLTRG